MFTFFVKEEKLGVQRIGIRIRKYLSHGLFYSMTGFIKTGIDIERTAIESGCGPSSGLDKSQFTENSFMNAQGVVKAMASIVSD